MKLTSSSTARRKTANAPWRSFGGPQMPSPVRRIAPKPRRCTESSPPSEISPARLAERFFLFMVDLQNPLERYPTRVSVGPAIQHPELLSLTQRANVAHQLVNLRLAQRTLEGRHSALAVGNDLSELRIGQLLDYR